MIFVTLPVQDLSRSRAFYDGLGFTFEKYWSDERTATLSVDENIVVKLLTRDNFAQLLDGEAGDPASGPTVITCLGAQSRELVDDLVAKAEAAGGRAWFPANEEPTTHTGSFADPDGHVWQLTWLEPVHVID
jgi:predicted lactoylglutathione lyase